MMISKIMRFILHLLEMGTPVLSAVDHLNVDAFNATEVQSPLPDLVGLPSFCTVTKGIADRLNTQVKLFGQ